MATVLKVLSASGVATVQNDLYGNQDVRYLTLGDKNPASGNHYHISITGKDAEIEWHEGDSIMVELSFCAYKTHGQWHMSHCSDSINFVEITDSNITEND